MPNTAPFIVRTPFPRAEDTDRRLGLTASDKLLMEKILKGILPAKAKARTNGRHCAARRNSPSQSKPRSRS